MITKIKNGISIKLNQEFGDSYTIYTDEIEQGFKEPCFFIKILNPTSTLVLGRRYKRTNSIDIHYFPSANGGNDEILETAEKLLEVAEYITVENDLIRGTGMKYEIIDNVLHFFVNYNMFVLKEVVPEEFMEDLKVVMEVDVNGN